MPRSDAGIAAIQADEELDEALKILAELTTNAGLSWDQDALLTVTAWIDDHR